jgi:L,D-transpeptidase catalytic domain
MVYKILPLAMAAFLSFAFNPTNEKPAKQASKIDPQLLASNSKSALEAKVTSVYNGLHAHNLALPQLESFSQALKGFYDLKEKGLVKKDILTLIDFSLSSNVKRLWVIDLSTNTVLLNSLVAHGRNTGEEFATSFSNTDSSFKSSLGFYATGEIYNGKHGKSLKLDGLERGVNDRARDRGVVMHAADYVSEDFIRNHNRLGRSQGCPAVPVELNDAIIDLIKNKSCLFIYHPSRSSLATAKLLS